MRLHDFIRTNREQILEDWEEFARTCAPASLTMDVAALRDHASEMLTVVATDLETYQGAREQTEKSKGQGPDLTADSVTAAEEHGAGRAESGFTVAQMVAEYRALRASVLRLWTRKQGELKSDDIEDLTRFNEAIDQSLAESVTEFNENVDNAKEMFLAILGHDLRNPLGAISTSAKFMLEMDELGPSHRVLATQIVDSASRTVTMIGDLLDFTRSRLGGGIPIDRNPTSLETVVCGVVEEITAAHPDSEIQVNAAEEQLGEWDAARISQALTNLIGNAVQHGSPGSIITVDLRGDEQKVELSIHNDGVAISGDRLDGIFNPMKARLAPRIAASGPTGSLGLGLYIAERIVNAHGGRIEVESVEDAGTTFTVHLPRRG